MKKNMRIENALYIVEIADDEYEYVVVTNKKTNQELWIHTSGRIKLDDKLIAKWDTKWEIM